MAKKNQQFNETKIFTDYQALAEATIPEIVTNLPNQKIGYHNDEVKQYLAHAGQTAIKPQQFNWIKNIFLTIVNPFNLLLIVIFGFQLGTFFVKDFHDPLALSSAIIIAIMMTLSATISLGQDYKAFGSRKKA